MGKELDKFATQLEIIKELHEPNTRRNICNKFTITDRTFRNYYNGNDAIRIGNVEFNYTIKETDNSLDVEMDGVEQENLGVEDLLLYKSSMHPVLLPLNMTEVYMLTNGLLDMLEKDSVLYKNYKHLAEKIYSQLSPYALNRLGDNRHGFSKLSKVAYESELEMYDKIMESKFQYAEKSRDLVRITFDDGNVIEGRVNRVKRKLILTGSDSDRELDVDNLGSIKKIEILD